MNSNLGTLKQLIDDGMYPVDERIVAEAILARASLFDLYHQTVESRFATSSTGRV